MSEDTSEFPIYPPISEYLDKQHKILRNDYRRENGNIAGCTLIARDIARLSLEAGNRPLLLSVTGELLSDGINAKPLIPKLFKGRVVWGGHIVCAEGDIVFDPIVGKPMIREEYRKEAFDEPVILEEVIPADFIEEFINR